MSSCVYYFVFVNEAKQVPTLIMGFRSLSTLPGGDRLTKPHRKAYVCPVSRSREATERLFAAWTPAFRFMLNDFPDEIGITIAECPNEQVWQRDSGMWKRHMRALGLPPPTWLFDDDPDFDRLVTIGESFEESDVPTPLWVRVLGSIAEDAAMSLVKRIIS